MFQRNLAGFKVQPDPGHCILLIHCGESAGADSTIRSGRVMRTGGVAQVTIKEPNDDVQGVPRFRNIHVVKESMEETFPHMEFGIDAQFQSAARAYTGRH